MFPRDGAEDAKQEGVDHRADPEVGPKADPEVGHGADLRAGQKFSLRRSPSSVEFAVSGIPPSPFSGFVGSSQSVCEILVRPESEKLVLK